MPSANPLFLWFSQIHHDPSYCQRSLSVELRRKLVRIQQVFITLLADPKIKHLPRECCCLGLAACRGIAATIESTEEMGEDASEAFNERLLRAFGQSTKYATSVYMETAAQAAQRRDTERRDAQGRETTTTTPELSSMEVEDDIGGTAGMSEAALGAYREMAAASVALGRHDILYGLLMLSANHPCWAEDDRRSLYR